MSNSFEMMVFLRQIFQDPEIDNFVIIGLGKTNHVLRHGDFFKIYGCLDYQRRKMFCEGMNMETKVKASNAEEKNKPKTPVKKAKRK